MHSGRMRTTHSSNHPQGRSASVHAGIHNPLGCGPGDPPGCGSGDPPLGVGLETLPLDVAVENPPGQTLSFPPWCGPGDPLDTCKACWDTPCNACWDTTPLVSTEFLTHASENITLPQTSFAGGNYRLEGQAGAYWTHMCTLATKILEDTEPDFSFPCFSDIKYIFLVGGFAESPMLQQEIRQEFGHLLRIIIPQDVGLTILKGTVGVMVYTHCMGQ